MPPKTRRRPDRPPEAATGGGVAKSGAKRRVAPPGLGALRLGATPPCPDCPYGGTRERKGIRNSGRPKFRARCSRCLREARSSGGGKPAAEAAQQLPAAILSFQAGGEAAARTSKASLKDLILISMLEGAKELGDGPPEADCSEAVHFL